jgi:hypothetical protein
VRDVKRFAIAVRAADELTVDIVDRNGNEVRRIADRLHVDPARPRAVRWNGRTDLGTVAPDGFYRVRVSLARSGRSVIVPALLRIDTRGPRPYVRAISPGPIVAPGTSGIVVRAARVSSRKPTEVRVWRTDGDTPAVVAQGAIAPGLHRWVWDGRVAGKPAPAGTYLVQLGVRDQAGNLGRVPRRVRLGTLVASGHPGLTVRALAAQPPAGPVLAGSRVLVGVNSLHRPYTWQLRRIGRVRPVAHGRQAQPKLTFKAPDGPSGIYLLDLRSGPAHVAVPILVQARRRTDVLVVVPMLTWMASGRVDDNGDGLPDTLAAGGPVRWPRVLTGMPAGLARDVAPLLIFLDRAHLPYDLTSDLALTLGDGPSADDRPGVLLAGTERWITSGYARRLRRYVADGGRVATIATDSLRRGVTLVRPGSGRPGELRQPTQPVDRDPFGARLGPLQVLASGTELRPIAGSASAPLLSFWDGSLTGFAAAEESAPPAAADRVRVLAGVGVEPVPEGTDTTALPPPPRPALTQSRVGKGMVIRIGLPGWAQRIAADPEVSQLTWNAYDLLRGTPPKSRGVR